ncbi:multi-sensor signal transduction histidine kinase [Desulfonatronospira thiodismutans ASO3-1]|uniref:histidine kinase n=1 Tax=Desulfonatronospira thiodismutans ASO3-1 TaxID=555779 RepID=D6SSQ3_9BACT|nr:MULTISPECIES: ATP-binding protein [Desulfonatronospira]EFI33719.1 multi-sensor signal transduction histidine kinase [Desulfonatronospira thiodismutans ASO3-1]RQD73555.1 MAG: PAS domain S-box protein [Desulfonatronospira sp. MSAO_Bac3]
MPRFRDLSLKHKIFLSTAGVVLLFSLSSALMARWILSGYMEQELKTRGVSIAQSIADHSIGHVLTRDRDQLVATIFDAAQLGERRHLVEYVVILDDEQNVLSHTFITPFPDDLRGVNPVQEEQDYSIRSLDKADMQVYDIAVPILEGIYQIGTVRLGLKKEHIEQVARTMNITFGGFTLAVLVVMFVLSYRISLYITRPMQKLTGMADQISRGDLELKTVNGLQPGRDEPCPAITGSYQPCWHVDRLLEAELGDRHLPGKPDYCRDCLADRDKSGDEVQQLADSFNQMVRSVKLYRKRVLESEHKYRSLFESGPVPVFVLDLETFEILDANSSAEKEYGYSRNELVGMEFTRLAPEFPEKLRTHLKQEPQDARIVYNKAIHYYRGNQPIYTNVEGRLSTYRNRDAVIVATTDITEMLEKDAQLIQASKMSDLGQLSAGVAHELNQPLNAIKMGSEFVQMMQQEGQDIPEEQLRQILGEINTQVDRATEIINNLREFGRKSDPGLEETDLNLCVQNVLTIIGQQIKLANIDLDFQPASQPVFIMAHKNRLEQVIFNLVTNARDAVMQKQAQQEPGWTGRIVIFTGISNGQAVLSVQDNGTGMPRSVVDKIFDPFFTTKEVGKGMGLGLSICYGIIQDYQGEIDIQSRENEGTTFRVFFSASDSHAQNSNPKDR